MGMPKNNSAVRKLPRGDYAGEGEHGALAGIRVLDLSRLFAGNLLTQILGDFGASVVKVEPTDGDTLRGWRYDGVETNWKLYARNKRSLGLNFRHPRAQKLLLRLASHADVFVESFRSGTLENMGLHPDALLEANPDLVIVRISGWGQDGPYRRRPGFGTLIEGIAGFASINGFPDREPVLPPMYLADAFAGCYGSTAVMVALRAVAEKRSGGQVIDLSLLDPLFHVLGPQAANFQMTGKVKPRVGSRSTNSGPRNAYLTKDGRYVALSASTQKMAERLFRAIGRPELITDERYATNAQRVRHVDDLDAIIGNFIAEKTQAENVAFFEEAEVTIGPIYDISQIVEDPHFIDRALLANYPDKEMETFPMHHVVPRLSKTPGTIRTPAPKLGEHTRGVLAAAGLAARTVQDLIDDGVVFEATDGATKTASTSNSNTDAWEETMKNGAEIEVVPLGAAVGAEVRGVDIAEGISDETLEQVRRALHSHGVIVLRGQDMSPGQQVEFCKRLGRMRVSFMTELSVPGVPELTVVSNIVKDGKPIGLVDAGALWHTDGSYLPEADMYTVLHAIQIPERDGVALGDTCFLSAGAVYEALPEDIRKKIDGAEGIHSFSYHIQRKIAANFKAPPSRKELPDVRHPAVRPHPVTGRMGIYLTEGHTRAIAGMPEDESRALLDRIAEFAVQPQFVYRHKWRVGDLLIWDNVATQHLAITDYGSMPRKLHRAGIATMHP